MKTGRLPCPDACACELGTKIVYFPRREWSAAVDDTEWEANLLKAMDASGHPDPTAELAAFAFAEDGVAVEVEDDDSRTKASLVLRAETAELCLAASRRLIEQLGVLGDGFVVSPSGAPTTTRKNGCKMFVDVTPTAAGKGCSTAHLMSVFGATSERVLVAGDSENDVAMMRLCCAPRRKSASRITTSIITSVVIVPVTVSAVTLTSIAGVASSAASTEVGEKAAAEAATLSDDAFDVRLATGAIALASIIENACAPEVAVGEQ